MLATAREVTCGLWVDSRHNKYIWLINNPTRALDDAEPYAIVIGGNENKGDAKWEFTAYDKKTFLDINTDYIFTKVSD